MANRQLYFDGHRFQAVAVQGHHWPHEIVVKGQGRRWEAHKPAAFWRTFSEVDLDSAADVEMIFNRYGDPVPSEPRHTAHWKNLKALLMVGAAAWDAPGADGISRISGDQQRLKLARWFLKDQPQPVVKMTDGLVPTAADLRDFMILSAAMMLADAVPMMRCLECGHWFAFEHAATRYCSPACRLAAHRKKGN